MQLGPFLQEPSPQAGSRRRYQHIRFRETRPVFPAFRMPPELARDDPMDLGLQQQASLMPGHITNAGVLRRCCAVVRYSEPEPRHQVTKN